MYRQPRSRLEGNTVHRKSNYLVPVPDIKSVIEYANLLTKTSTWYPVQSRSELLRQFLGWLHYLLGRIYISIDREMEHFGPITVLYCIVFKMEETLVMRWREKVIARFLNTSVFMERRLVCCAAESFGDRRCSRTSHSIVTVAWRLLWSTSSWLDVLRGRRSTASM